MRNNMIDQNDINERKEWECNNKENKIRTNLLLFINKETQKGLSSYSVRINSKHPKDILAEYEEYEIIINTPLIIGIKRNEVVVSDQYHRNLNQKRKSTVEYAFTTKMKNYHKKKIANLKPVLTQSPTASFVLSPRGDIDSLFVNSAIDQNEDKMNKGMFTLQQIAASFISKPLPKMRLLRKATKHETMGINEKQVMKRLEQITFREETSFYNDSNEIHAIDLEVYNGLSQAAIDLSKVSYQRLSKRSKTDQHSNGNCELIWPQMRY